MSDDKHGWRRDLAPALVLAIVACCVGALPARAAPPDPPTNLQIGPVPVECFTAPVSDACEVPIIGYLDAARQTMGLGPYELPSDFVALAPERQLFILVNLDRRAYSLPLISGISPELDSAAQADAVLDQDPQAPSSARAVFASEWAGGLVNALEAYYLWMYSDGYPSLNVDCASPAAAGCWVHRRGILFAFDPSVKLTMGAADATDQAGREVTGMLIAATRRAGAPAEDYTWAQAEANGAGRSSGAPSALPRPARRVVAQLARPRITGAKTDSSTGMAAVYFTVGRSGAHFECALAPQTTAKRPRYSACGSPASYEGLASGVYEFFVRTFSSTTRHSAPAERRVEIA